MKKNYKFIIYPLLVILLVLLLSVFKINGSSVDMFREVIFREESNTDEIDTNSLFGSPRAIRSDQYMVTIPMIVSQDINNEATINTDMGEGTNLITQNIPSRNVFALFRPTFLTFYFIDDTGFSYSFHWWAEIGLLLISTYLLLLHLTKKNLWISIGGSLLFVMTPFTQWWNQTNMITWISFGVLFFLKILKEKDWRINILYGLGLSYSIVTFALLLYPAFQVSVTYIALGIAIGYVISEWKEIKGNLKLSIPILVASVILGGSFVLLFIKEYKDVISIIANTVYPGARFITAGGGDRNLLFNGFYNILLQRDSNTAPFGNQSEFSNFFLLFPPLLVWVIYKNIDLFKKKKKLDWIAICISLVLIFFTAHYFLPLPSIVSKISLMFLIPHQRLLIGFGFGSYILMLYILSKKDIYKPNKSIVDTILLYLLSLSFGVHICSVGIKLYTTSPDFFKSPRIVSPEIKIIGASSLVTLLVFLLLKNYKKLFLIILLSFAFLSTVYINPIRRGLDVLTNTEIAKYIRETSEKDDSKWVAFGDNRIAQYALANNASIINGVHIYPQFDIWKVLDPQGQYIDIYNRYAHIGFEENIGNNSSIQLLLPDALVVNINPCDPKLKELGTKYILTTKPLHNTSCLKNQKRFERIIIYEVNQ